MNRSSFTGTSSTLAVIVLLIYIGHWYGTFCAIAPTNWFIPTDLAAWSVNSVGAAIVALNFLVFLFMPPICYTYGILVVAAVICLIVFRPKRFAPRQMLLLLPVIPTFFCPIWAVYVMAHRTSSPVFAAYQNSWEMHVLEALSVEASIPIAVATFLVLAYWREERIFALSILFLELVLLYVEFVSASWPVANIWL